MKIIVLRNTETLNYAAEELKKYLCMMCETGGVKIAYNPTANDGFRLGSFSDFGIPLLFLHSYFTTFSLNYHVSLFSVLKRLYILIYALYAAHTGLYTPPCQMRRYYELIAVFYLTEGIG